jgi:hypothetical protein
VSLHPRDLRQRIEDGLSAVLGALTPAWEVSRLAWDHFPGADPREVEALCFAVGLPSTTFADGDRQRKDVRQAQSSTQVGVKFASQLRLDAHVSDYDTALEREVTLVEALRSIAGVHGPAVHFDSVDRSIVGDGTVFLGDVRLTVTHAYPIG